MANRSATTASFPLHPTRAGTPPSIDSLPISTSSYAINAPRSTFNAQHRPHSNSLPRGLCLSGSQIFSGMPGAGSRTVINARRSGADSGSPPRYNLAGAQMLERVMNHNMQGSIDSIMLGGVKGNDASVGKAGKRTMSDPVEDVFGKMNFVPSAPSLTTSTGSNRTPSIQTQSTESGDVALLNAKTLTLSPSTESVRRVAFDVAESALRGTEEDDGMDIEQRIRMVERKANAELRSKIASSTSSSRSASPPHQTRDAKHVPPPIGSGLSAAAPAFEFKPKYTLPWEEAAAEQAGVDVLTYQRQNMLASQGVNFQFEPLARNKFGLTTGQALGNGVIEKPGHSRSKSDIPWTTSRGSPLILNSPAEIGQSFGEGEDRLNVNVSADQEVQELVNELPVPRSLTPLPFKRPTFTQDMLLPAAQLADAKEEKVARRSGVPTLTEIKERMLAKQAAQQGEGPKQTARSKRYSLESQESYSSNDSAASGPSLPSTPQRSRLPAFLQHRRNNSSSSVNSDIAIYSPTKSVHFADELVQFSPPPKTPQVNCPTLRVTPPSVEAIVQPRPTARNRANGVMQVMLEDMNEEHSTLNQIVDTQRKKLELDLLPLAAVPIITCTPATAPGIKISPLRVLEAQIQQKRKAESGDPENKERQQRSLAMLQTLRRRSDRAAPAVLAA